jgi:hypothetical protein
MSNLSPEPELLSLEDRDSYRRRLFGIVKHINNVNETAQLLAERIIETAKSPQDLDFARRLVQRVRSHDLSKFEGIEWEALHRESDDELLQIAIHQHQQTNNHHPEYFVGGIAQMNDLQLAELVCDWKSRSTEMGTDLRTYIRDRATARFNFSTKSAVYKKLKRFVDLILDDQFK